MTTDPFSRIPKQAIYRGGRVRIIGYEDHMFLVLDHNDQRRKVRRENLTFIREKKNNGQSR